MIITLKQSQNRKGVAIMEVLAASVLAGIVITGIAVAMKNITRLSADAKREALVSRLIYNELRTAATKPQITEGQLPPKLIESWDIELITEVIPLTEVTNVDGVILNNLFKIEVTAHFQQNNEQVTRTAETWRNSSFYAR